MDFFDYLPGGPNEEEEIEEDLEPDFDEEDEPWVDVDAVEWGGIDDKDTKN